MKSILRRKERVWFGLLAMSCLGVLAVYWLTPHPVPPAPFVRLHRPFARPVTIRERIGHAIPTRPSWAWAWRLEELVFGKRQPVNLAVEGLALPEASAATVAGQLLGPPSFPDAEGLQVWLLPVEQFKRLRQQLRQVPGATQLGAPRLGMADAMFCRLFQGEPGSPLQGVSPAGLTVDCYPMVQPDSVYLLASLVHSEFVTNAGPNLIQPALGMGSVTVQTNWDETFGIQIPRAMGVFLLRDGSAGRTAKSIGFFIDPLQPVAGK